MADKADKTITFEMLRIEPDRYKGKILILGGAVTQIVHTKQGSLIGLAQKPLDIWGRPTDTSSTGGQFLVFVPRYIDSLMYPAGLEMTVAGEVAGTSLNEKRYDDPVLISRELKPWPKEKRRQDPQVKWGDPLYEIQRQPY